nr:MAG TPA: hypothetical protein [Crassvirales sp.]
MLNLVSHRQRICHHTRGFCLLGRIFIYISLYNAPIFKRPMHCLYAIPQ